MGLGQHGTVGQSGTYVYDAQGDLFTRVLWVGLNNSQHTIMPMILRSKFLWIVNLFHLVVYSMHYRGTLEEIPRATLHINTVKMGTAIFIYFGVFYSNQCFARWLEFASLLRAFRLDLIEAIFQASLSFTSKQLVHGRLISRLLLGVAVMFFHEAQHGHGHGKHGDHFWIILANSGIVKDEEIEFLRKQPVGSRMVTMTHWCADVARSGYGQCEQEKRACNEVGIKEFLVRLQRFRNSLGNMMDKQALPVPYPYYHILIVMHVVTLPFWAYYMGMSGSAFMPPAFFLLSALFTGFLELAAQLAQPFGNDEVDLPLKTWLSEIVEDVSVLLQMKYSDAAEIEQSLASETKLHVNFRAVRSLLSDRTPRSEVIASTSKRFSQRSEEDSVASLIDAAKRKSVKKWTHGDGSLSSALDHVVADHSLPSSSRDRSRERERTPSPSRLCGISCETITDEEVEHIDARDGMEHSLLD